MTQATNLLPDLFEQQVARTPDAVAVVCGDTRLTYLGLDVRANRLAYHLIQLGAGPEQLVAVLANRTADLIVALLAVLKSGAGYIPIGIDDPQGRVDHVLADSGASLIITSPGSAAAGAANAIVLGDHDTEATLASCPVTAPTDADRVRPLTGQDVSYVIYTSGSTGRPKGVVIEHRALSTYLRHAATHYPAVAGRTLLHSSVSFDMAVTSVFAPLVTGGSVIMVDLHAAASGAATLDPALRPTFLKVTPSHLAVLRELPEAFEPTEQLVIGGEALLGHTLQPWRGRNPSATVVNEYGPTEATVGCCVYYVEPGDAVEPGTVPIGRPTDGTRLYVLDDQLRPVPDGEAGELYIAGEQLSRGYLGRPDLTEARFVRDPFGVAGERMYRTGDRVRARKNGDLEYLGRLDEQVKVNGYRIEPGEVEAVIVSSGLVAQAAVIARDHDRGVRKLIGYVVVAEARGLDTDQLRAHIAEHLPDYMIPVDFVVLQALPLTANGKLDRAALPEPGPAHGHGSAARDPRESMLCRMFGELTGADEVGIDDDFVALGGTSIAAARLVTRARREGVQITLMDVLRKRTVRAILAV